VSAANGHRVRQPRRPNGAAAVRQPKMAGGPMAGGRTSWTSAEYARISTASSGSTKATTRAGTKVGEVASRAPAAGQQAPGQVQQ